MKDRIQKLCKRLNKFTLEEIALIAELEEFEIKILLQGLMKENLLIIHDNNYIYNNIEKETKLKKRLPKMFEYHSQEIIEMIIKCFCAEIEVDKVIKILKPEKHCINKFFAYFREQIYQEQFEKLNQFFREDPYIPRERDYMGKKNYLYLYEDKLFVSDKCLKHSDAKSYSNTERLEIKNIYLRTYRKVQSIAYKKYFHLHLAEQIWRCEKYFLFLETNLKSNLFN